MSYKFYIFFDIFITPRKQSCNSIIGHSIQEIGDKVVLWATLPLWSIEIVFYTQLKERRVRRDIRLCSLT